MLLPKHNLVLFTWGNVSQIDRSRGLVAIKPSGVAYESLTWEDIVVLDLDGNIVDGKYRPSSDTATHLELYKQFDGIGGVVHTHSTFATACAQSCKDVTAYGTTHADYFYGDIPCTRPLTQQEIEDAYELNTGRVIVETFRERGIDPTAVPGVLVANHGPFTWGADGFDAVHNAVVLDQVCRLAVYTRMMNPEINRMGQHILDKHYFRKHGENAYYGQ